MTAVIVIVTALCLNVFVQQKFITTYTYTELEYRGYDAQDVNEIEIKHSYLNRILGYNEWRISVEFEKIPDIFFWFTYRDNKIIFQGVSSDPLLDKEAVLDYSERFKNGTLLEKFVFETENITKITFYTYANKDNGFVVSKEYLDEITTWIGTFVLDEKVKDIVLAPGSNSVSVEIEYADGAIVRNGLSTTKVDGVAYYMKHADAPECYFEILEH